MQGGSKLSRQGKGLHRPSWKSLWRRTKSRREIQGNRQRLLSGIAGPSWRWGKTCESLCFLYKAWVILGRGRGGLNSGRGLEGQCAPSGPTYCLNNCIQTSSEGDAGCGQRTWGVASPFQGVRRNGIHPKYAPTPGPWVRPLRLQQLDRKWGWENNGKQE